MMQLQVSEAVERRVRLIRLASAPISSTSASTSQDGFKGLEACGMMAGMKHRAMYLTFSLVHGIDDDIAKGDLVAEVVTKHMQRFDWYDQSARRKQEYRKKLNAVVACAVSRLVGEECTATRSANVIGVARQNYHKTWFNREAEIFSLFCEWYFEAEKVFTAGRLS